MVSLALRIFSAIIKRMVGETIFASKRHQRRLWNQLMVALTSFVLLPLPMPIIHRHDSFDSLAELASHLESQHAGVAFAEPDAAKSHWHFELPDRVLSIPDGDESDHLPNLPAEYLAGPFQAVCGSVQISQFSKMECNWLDVPPLSFFLSQSACGPRALLAQAANKHFQETQSSVMRC